MKLRALFWAHNARTKNLHITVTREFEMKLKILSDTEYELYKISAKSLGCNYSWRHNMQYRTLSSVIPCTEQQ